MAIKNHEAIGNLMTVDPPGDSPPKTGICVMSSRRIVPVDKDYAITATNYIVLFEDFMKVECNEELVLHVVHRDVSQEQAKKEVREARKRFDSLNL